MTKPNIFSKLFYFIPIIILIFYSCTPKDFSKLDTEVNDKQSSVNDVADSVSDLNQSNQDQWIKEGMYKIGIDLPADEYLIVSNTGTASYYQLAKDSTGSISSIISNDNFTNHRYLSVFDGQYLTVVNASMNSSENVSLIQKTGIYPSGMYRVGIDIKSDEYKIIPDDSSGYCYYQ
jgi:hypothetical protein